MSSALLTRFAAAVSLALLVTACAGAKPSPSADPTPVEPSITAESTASPSIAPAETAGPAPTVEPPSPTTSPAPANFLAGLRYSCGGADFPIEIFDVPERAEDSSDPPAAVLRGELMLFGTRTWWLINRTPTTAQYVGINQYGTYLDLFAEIYEGEWRAGGYGTCVMGAVVPDSTVVTWWIRKDDWPSPDDRTLRMTVRDECPKTVADRMHEPIVRTDADSIVIILSTHPVPKPHPHCGSTGDSGQLAQVTIQLDEAVGARDLFDGETLPLRNAHKRSDPIPWCCG